MEKTDIVIIGAGVVGLAVAHRLSAKNKNVVILEKEDSFGKATSSRNSEIIHSGIYYDKGSLKARLCVEGRHLLYQFCKEHNVACRQIGKLIVAGNDAETGALKQLIKKGRDNGVNDLELISRQEIKKIEPDVEASCAIYSPSTGIIDSHQLMKCLARLAEDNGALFVYNCEARGISKKNNGYQVTARDADGTEDTIQAEVVINCAGLYSDKVAEAAGLDIKKLGYKIHYSKGEYFRLSSKKAGLINRLIYPPPDEYSLGIHTVTDMQGEVKLGPNAFYVDEISYDVDPLHKEEFYVSAKKILPFLEEGDLSADTAGVRPKIQAKGEPAKDFVIKEEGVNGLADFINLIGIESPGLTASLSIAKYVEDMIK